MKILIVDDEKEIRTFLKASLEAAGFIVDTAEDGENGLFMAKTNTYDLVLLDMIMPYKTGDQVCQELRDAGYNAAIIILSVRSEATTKTNLLNIGADDYLSKPFSFDELLARINAVLRRPKEISDEELKIDNLVLNDNKYTVKRGEISIHLTKKEFSLLEYLMINTGKVLTRTQIMEHVWDMNADPFSNTIETHMRNLRKKIDLKNEKKLIHTISGRGYKIDLQK